MLIGNAVVAAIAFVLAGAGIATFQAEFPFDNDSLLPYGDAGSGKSESYGIGWYFGWAAVFLSLLTSVLTAFAARTLELSDEQKAAVEEHIKVFVGDAYDDDGAVGV